MDTLSNASVASSPIPPASRVNRVAKRFTVTSPPLAISNASTVTNPPPAISNASTVTSPPLARSNASIVTSPPLATSKELLLQTKTAHTGNLCCTPVPTNTAVIPMASGSVPTKTAHIGNLCHTPLSANPTVTPVAPGSIPPNVPLYPATTMESIGHQAPPTSASWYPSVQGCPMVSKTPAPIAPPQTPLPWFADPNRPRPTTSRTRSKAATASVIVQDTTTSLPWYPNTHATWPAVYRSETSSINKEKNLFEVCVN